MEQTIDDATQSNNLLEILPETHTLVGISYSKEKLHTFKTSDVPKNKQKVIILKQHNYSSRHSR